MKLQLNDNPFWILLGFVMVLVGVSQFFKIDLMPTTEPFMIGVLVIAILLLLLVFAGKVVNGNVGMVATVLWLLLLDSMAYFHYSFQYSNIIMAVLPIGAGFFLLFGL